MGLLLLIGAAAGALAGAVVGGVGGRLVMLVLRLASDPFVNGMMSDDGFEIGRVTFGGTVQLMGGMAALGAANGALYVVLRGSIPPRLRLLLWSLFGAAVGGMAFVHADGVDFTVLEPLWFAVLSFVALPGLGALGVAVLVERWLGNPHGQPHPAALAIAAALGTVALALVAALGLAVLAARRLGLAGRLGAVGRVVVPPALVLATVAAAWVAFEQASQILG